MQPHSSSPIRALATFVRYRELIAQLTMREVTGRYRGSFAGLAWSFLNPLAALAMYTFVFGIVFKARWGASTESTFEFSLILFAGLLMHGLLSECITRAPYLIIGNSSYVKQVVFPLEILSVVSLLSAVFHTLVGLGILLAAWAIIHGLSWTVVAIPFLLLPLCIGALGLSWMLAAVTVYLRDLAQIVSFVSVGLLFFSPVFYPASAVPDAVRPILMLNPLTFVIEAVRGALFQGTLPDGASFAIYCTVAMLMAFCGYAIFQRARSGFADVV